MREIKFRHWNTLEKEMNYSQGYVLSMIGEHGEGQSHYSMQYTGLKDKNGADVYEGDILQHYVAGYHFGVFAVKWEDTGFWNVGINEKESEVIGNIYENPELLERL